MVQFDQVSEVSAEKIRRFRKKTEEITPGIVQTQGSRKKTEEITPGIYRYRDLGRKQRRLLQVQYRHRGLGRKQRRLLQVQYRHRGLGRKQKSYYSRYSIDIGVQEENRRAITPGVLQTQGSWKKIEEITPGILQTRRLGRKQRRLLQVEPKLGVQEENRGHYSRQSLNQVFRRKTEKITPGRV